MTTIRTPDDEVTKPGWFTPPFREGWWYEGQTYATHSPYSVDWNRRTKEGGWVQDEGDPVLAIAPGTVSKVVKADGLVMLDHADGYQSEYRHMSDIKVSEGDKVQRSDRLGSIGNVAGSGRSTSPHLHHVHYKDGKRIKQRFEGKNVPTSVGDSDTKPSAWVPPTPVRLQGPPARATWESAFRESEKERAKVERERDQKATTLAVVQGAKEAIERDLTAANARIAELEGQQPDGEPVDTVPMEFSYADYPVVDGVATLPDGSKVETTAKVVRVPMLTPEVVK